MAPEGSLYNSSRRHRLKPAATISMLKTPAGCIPLPGSPFLSFLQNQSLRRTDVHTDRKFHVPAAVTFHGHMMSGRRGNDPEGTDHDTHPAGDAGRFVDINQPGLRIPAHRSIGAGINAWRHFAMAAVTGPVVAVHMDSWNRTGFLMDGRVRLLGDGPDLHPAPKPTGGALGTVLLIPLVPL